MKIIKPNFLYNSVCTLKTATETNYKGNITLSYTSTSGIQCRAVEASADEAEKYGKKAAERGYRFHIDPSYDVNTNDIITFESEDYEVVGINPHHSASVYQTIMCFKVLDN